MADPTHSSTGKRTGLRKKLAIGFGIAALLVVALYFVLTSAMFVKGVVLPRVGSALNAKVTAEDVSFSPFSSVSMRGFKVETTEPVIQASSARLRYSLFDIIGGNINVSELSVDDALISIVKNADGTSNLDPILKKLAEDKVTQDKPSEPPGVLQVDIRNVSVKNATLRYLESFKGGGVQKVDISNVNVSLDQFKNGAAGKLTFSSDLAFDKQSGSPSAHDSIKTKASANYEFTMTPELKPQSLKGNAKVEVGEVQGAFNEVGGISAVMESELTPTEIKMMGVKFVRGGQSVATVNVSGPLDTTKNEGNLKVEVQNLDRQVLNLLGAAFGMDFGATVVNSSSQIVMADGGKNISVDGKVTAKQFSIKKGEAVSAPLDLDLAYQLKANRAASNAVIQTLTLAGRQKDREILKGNTTKPMTFTWGKGTPAAGEDAAFELAVNELDLADWKPFVGGAMGKVNLKVNIQSAKGGKEITAGVDGRINGYGTDPEHLENLQLKTQLQIVDFNVFHLRDLNVGFDQQNVSSMKLSGSANFTKETKEADFNLVVDANLPEQKSITMKTAGKGRFDLDKGGVDASININELMMNDPKGTAPSKPLTAQLVVKTSLQKQVLELTQVGLTLTPTERAKNTLNVTGKVDLSKPKAATGKIKIESDGLDATPYFDIFSSFSGKSDPKSPKPEKAPPPSTPPSEPDAIMLPVADFVVEVDIRHFYLREIHMTDWVATTKIEAGKVKIDPFKMKFNDAPINATVNLDLGQPGYTYDISGSVDKLPIEPFVNTFAPDKKGKVKGDLFANVKVKGAGITGVNLRKNLDGNLSMNLTNANVHIVEGWIKKVLAPISVVLGLPELMGSPLDFMVGEIKLGNGNIQVQKFVAQSKMIRATSSGTVPIADIVANSPLDQPVEVALPGDFAKKFNPTGKAPADGYMDLPKFVQVKGTLGEPEVKTDKLAILGVGVLGVGGRVGGEAGDVVRGIGGILSGKQQQPASTNQAQTNAPAEATAPADTEQAPSKLNPFNLFKKKKN